MPAEMEVKDLFPEIQQFVSRQAGVPPESISTETRIWEDLRLYGDDVLELVGEFGKQFGVDVSGFRWYHHTGPEGCNPLWPIRKPWWERKTQIPLAVRDLVDSANRGTWSLEYPDDEREP